ncbi:MAG: ABC transporter permease [Bacillota bacterium]
MEARSVQIQATEEKRFKPNINYKKIGVSLLVILAFFVMWSVTVKVISSAYLPTPEGSFRAVGELVINGDFDGYSIGDHIWASLLRVLAGFCGGVIMGIVLGMLMGIYPSIYRTMKIIIEPIRFIPPIAWIPMAIVLLSGFSRYVFLIWFGAFFPVFISVIASIPKVDPILKDVVKVYGGNWFDIVKKIVIPSVTPEILAGMRIGLGECWMCIVAAEMVGGESAGLGRLILKYADRLLINEVVVGMLIIGIIGLICNEAVLRLEKKLFKWRTEITI